MRAVHPNYEVVAVRCACGAEFQTRSTRTSGDDYSLEICSECHPFYTGTQKIVDSEGRVERYRKKLAAAEQAKTAAATAKAKKKKASTLQVKKPPKVGKVVPIEVKPPKARERGRFGPGGGPGGGRGGPGAGRGGPGAGRGAPRGADAPKADAPATDAPSTDAPAADAPKSE